MIQKTSVLKLAFFFANVFSLKFFAKAFCLNFDERWVGNIHFALYHQVNEIKKAKPVFSVAVIEDDVITLDLITDALETRLSATVYPFSRSKLARDFLLQQSPASLQLIISDQIMKEYDGLSLLKACRASNLQIPFLLITAEPNKKLVMEARKLGASGFLAKPLDMDELADKAKSFVLSNK